MARKRREKRPKYPLFNQTKGEPEVEPGHSLRAYFGHLRCPPGGYRTFFWKSRSGRADIALPPPALSLLPVACESILPVASEGSNDMSFASSACYCPIHRNAMQRSMPPSPTANRFANLAGTRSRCGWRDSFRVRGSRRYRIRTRSTNMSRPKRRSAAHRAQLAINFDAHCEEIEWI